MKGVVFTEFLEMVDDDFSYETTEKIIRAAGVKGVYTQVGTYDHREIVKLVVALSDETAIPVTQLLKTFGEYLFNSFSKKFESFFVGANHPFDFLQNVESYIHKEVRKIYPEAQFPTFEIEILDEQTMKMLYRSERSMGDLAHGLIQGCFNYFEKEVNIAMNNINEGTEVEFLLKIPE